MRKLLYILVVLMFVFMAGCAGIDSKDGCETTRFILPDWITEASSEAIATTEMTEMTEATKTIETIETTEATEATDVIETTTPTVEFNSEPSLPEETVPETETVAPVEPETNPAQPSISQNDIVWYSDYRTWNFNEVTTTAGGSEFNIDFLAKLLFAEAGIMGWEGQVYVCSAILNFCDRLDVSVWTAGHTNWMFAVSEIVDYQKPTQMQYDVIDYVLNGGRVMGVYFFRTDHYHSFGTPVCKIENVYFSK